MPKMPGFLIPLNILNISQGLDASCTHTCMILFYHRFDKTAIQIQLLKDQLQLTLVRRPAEQVGKGSCKSTQFQGRRELRDHLEWGEGHFCMFI